MKRTLSILFLAAGLVVFAGLTRWQSVSEKPIIQTDGQGYYAYLPAVFIYQDLRFSFVDETNERYYDPNKRAVFRYLTAGNVVNKYFVGTAVMEVPFFLLAHVATKISGQPSDGYSAPYQLAIAIAAIFYLCLGLWFLTGFLKALGFKWPPIFWTGVFVVFATNLLYYTIYESSMSHVFSFCTISGFLYFAHKAFNEERSKLLLLVGLMFGLTVLIRPTNGIVLLALPAVTGGAFNFLSSLEALFKDRLLVLLSILLAVGIISIQPFIYWIQTGHLFVDSYTEGGFDFLSPEVYNVLFSYRKGLFVFSPILFLGLIGIIAGFKREKERNFWLLALLAVAVWIISSWWMWYYGGSFGQRSFIEYIPFFAVGLAYLIQYGWGWFRPFLVIAIGVGLTVVSLIQTYQYVNNILPFDGLNKEKYWNIFLLTRDDVAWYYSPGDAAYKAKDSLLIIHSMEENLGWNNEDLITDEDSKNGTMSAKMGADKSYGITLKKQVDDIPFVAKLVRIGAWVKTDSVKTDLSFVCSIEDSTGSAYYWKRYVAMPQLDGKNEWSWVEAVFKCGHQRNVNDTFVIFPMKSDRATVFIDDMEVSFVDATWR